jgi:hypothetical protein
MKSLAVALAALATALPVSAGQPPFDATAPDMVGEAGVALNAFQ